MLKIGAIAPFTEKKFHVKLIVRNLERYHVPKSYTVFDIIPIFLSIGNFSTHV